MKLVNAYPGTLVLPDGTEILPGAKVDLPDDLAENAGVKEWLDAGYLVKPSAVKAAPSEDAAALKKALAEAEGAVAALTAELEAARATNADLEKVLADTTAELEAATKPAEPQG